MRIKAFLDCSSLILVPTYPHQLLVAFDISSLSAPRANRRSLSLTMSRSGPTVGNRKDVTSTNKIFASQVAKVSPQYPWVDLNIPPQELRLSATLTNGQCFNWMVVHQDEPIDGIDVEGTTPKNRSRKRTSAWGNFNEEQWIGVLRISHNPDRCVALTLKETPTSSLYRILHWDPMESHPLPETSSISDILHDYFQLHTPLFPLYKAWSSADNRLCRIATCIPGVRILQQDPIECLFSFLCSSNNNIPRITKILSHVRRTMGRKLVTVESSHPGECPIDIYSFPTLLQWSTATDTSLRDIGLGYRAKYLIQTRDLLVKLGNEDYLYQLRGYHKTYDSYDSYVQDQLIQFSGVGRKVADCVALFSLDQTNAIPVDVHVQQIATRDFDSSVLRGKSLTPTVYRQVGDLFRSRFGVHAGWAHSLLFVAELPSFRDALPLDLIQEMDEFSKKEKERKSLLKEKRKLSELEQCE